MFAKGKLWREKLMPKERGTVTGPAASVGNRYWQGQHRHLLLMASFSQ